MSKNYKFKSLKVYASSEWMVDSSKKYRRVFDKDEISYLRSELSFYNKKFDEKDWTANVNIKAYKLTENNKKEEICSLSKFVNVSKKDNIAFVYESWGVENPGGYWKTGTYECQAYIDDELIGTSLFYIYDLGKVSADENPYLDLEDIRLYEGDFEGFKQTDRKYLKTFSKSYYPIVLLTIEKSIYHVGI